MNENAKKAYEAFTKSGQAEGGKSFVGWDQLNPSAQGAWSAAVDAARDHAQTGDQKAGQQQSSASTDPNVRNQDPTGTQGTTGTTSRK